MKKVIKVKTRKPKSTLFQNESGVVAGKRTSRKVGVGLRFNRAINRGLMVVSRSLSRWAHRKSSN